MTSKEDTVLKKLWIQKLKMDLIFLYLFAQEGKNKLSS